MKLNNRNIQISLSILLFGFGLLAGWLLFSGEENAPEDHDHAVHEADQHDNETWTCSMHPQIRQQEPGDCPICGMDLIPVEEGSTSENPYRFEMTEAAVKLANIQTSFVKKSTPVKEVFLTGKVKINKNRTSTQSAHIPGRLESLYVNYEGQRIRKGEVIASVYAPGLVTAQEELLETRGTGKQLQEAARQKLRQWNISEKTINEILQSGKIRQHLDIHADHSGIVYRLNVEEGDYVKEGSKLFELTLLDDLWVDFDAYEEDLSWLEVGDSIKFRVNGVPGKVFREKITFISPIMHEHSRIATVRVKVDNEGKLKPGMFAEGSIFTAPRDESEFITVPKSAVMWTGKRSVIYLADFGNDQPGFEMKQVTLGEELGNEYIVLDGLQKGDRIVTNGTFTVDAAAQLNNKASMMNTHLRVEQMEKPEKEERATITKLEAPAEFQKQLSDFTAVYLNMTESLVASNGEAVKAKAEELLESLSKIDMGLLNHEAHMKWMEYHEILKNKTRQIASTTGLEKQRAAYKPLSRTLIEALNSFGSGQEKDLFVQYCPMADSDQGGYWVSLHKEIRNPYFGDMMLKCGETRDTIK